MKPIKLNNWSVILKKNPYQAPELGINCLHGIAENHPNYEPNTEITTTAIYGKKENLIVTRNNYYELLEPNKDYESLYPDAKNRLLNSLPEAELHFIKISD